MSSTVKVAALTAAALLFSDGNPSLQPCAIEDVKGLARCGAIEVQEDRDREKGRRISLNVIVLKATGPTSEPEPLLVLQGGPGQGGTRLADFYARVFAKVRETRDIVLVDVRGTGKSNALNCDVLAPPYASSPDLMPIAAVTVCRTQLEKRADLRLYTTSIVVEDLEAVRRALGYERLHLYGTSYGTRVALEYIRRHTDRIKTAAMKGVVPPSLAMPIDHARNAQEALETILERCEEDRSCRPDGVRRDLVAVIGRLAREPASVRVKRRDGTMASVRLDGGAFAEAFRNMLYSPRTGLQAPAIIRRALEGDLTAVADVALRTKDAFNGELSLGMFLSVTCAEDVPRIDPATISKAVKGTFLGDYRIRQQIQACKAWPRVRVPPDFHQPVRADTPVLLMSGDMDPVTPASYGEEIVQTLSSGRHVVFKDNGHAIGNAESCIGSLVHQLTAGVSPARLDAYCADPR